MHGDTLLDAPPQRSWGGILSSAWRHRVVIVLAVIAGSLAGYGGSMMLPPRYSASASVYLKVTTPFQPVGQLTSQDPVRFVANQSELMTTTPVLELARARSVEENLSLAAIRDSIEIRPSGETNRITVTATRPTAEAAKSLADSVASSYRDDAAARVGASLRALVDQVQNPGDRQSIQLQAALYGDGVEVVENASLPSEPSSPRPLQNAILLGLLVLLVSTGACYLFEQWSRSRAPRPGAEEDGDETDGPVHVAELPVENRTRNARRVAVGLGAPDRQTASLR